MVLEQKQTQGSMEQKREPRNKPTPLQSSNLQQRRQDCKTGKRFSPTSIVGKTGQLHVKKINEIRTHPLTMHKNKLKMA